MTVSVMGLAEIKVNAASVADGASIAAYVTDAAGTLVTSTLVGGAQSLDVNVTQSALPTGAATEVTLASVLSTLGSWDEVGGTGTYVATTTHGAAVFAAVDASSVFSPMNLDASGNLKVSGMITDSAATSILQQAIVVGTSAVKLPATPLTGRINLVIQNTGTKTVFVGSSSVTSTGATRGPYIEKGGFMSLDVAASVDVYGIASAAGGEVTILEAA